MPHHLDLDHIPRFEPTPEQHNMRAPQFFSPRDGHIVELFPNVFHANPITQEMLDAGRWTVYSDFRIAAKDPESNLNISLHAASRGFSYIFAAELDKAVVAHSEATGTPIQTYREGSIIKRYRSNPYAPYVDWASGTRADRRSELLIANQAVWDTYERLRSGTANERKYPFLKIIELIFEAQEPEFPLPEPVELRQF